MAMPTKPIEPIHELGGRHRPLLGERRHDERDEPDVHRVERPADARPDEQSPVLRR